MTQAPGYYEKQISSPINPSLNYEPDQQKSVLKKTVSDI